MTELPFHVFAEDYPQQLSPEMLSRYEQDDFFYNSPIDLTAKFDPTCRLEVVRSIGANCFIGANTILKDGVSLGDDIRIAGYSVLESGVDIGHEFHLERGAYLAEGATVAEFSGWRRHYYLRKTVGRATIGANVLLPNEVQLGDNAVIPTSDSIAQIGRFGTSKRMVTVYGSPYEPLYSVGCQYRITIGRFKQRVCSNTETVPQSATDYQKHMPEIEALGECVQAAYEREENLVEELLEQRADALANLDV